MKTKLILFFAICFAMPGLAQAQGPHEIGIGLRPSGGMWGFSYNPVWFYKYNLDQNAIRLRVDQLTMTTQSANDRNYHAMSATMSLGYEFRHDLPSAKIQVIHGPELGGAYSSTQGSVLMTSQTVTGRYIMGLRIERNPSWYLTLESFISYSYMRTSYDGEQNDYTTIGVFNQPLLLGVTYMIEGT